MQYIRTLISFLFIFVISLTANAQRAEFGVVAGSAGYIGDLNQYNLLKFSGISAGVFAKVNFTPFIGLGMHYNYGNIKGDDTKSNNQQFRDRGLNFNTKLNEVSLIADVNFLDAFSPISKRRFTPYVFAGIGGVLFTPKASYNGNTFDFNKDVIVTNADIGGTPIQYKPYAITIPYGAGVKYRLTSYLTLSSQIGYRTALTDYLDDVGDYYVTPPLIPGPYNPPTDAPYNPSTVIGIGAPGTQRGDLRKRDTYMFVSIGISYNFVSQKCFTF